KQSPSAPAIRTATPRPPEAERRGGREWRRRPRLPWPRRNSPRYAVFCSLAQPQLLRANIAGDSPGHCHLSDQAVGVETSPSQHGCGHAHPALRLSRQFEYSSPLPGARRRLPTTATGAAIFHEAAPRSTDELEAVLLKIITRTMHTGGLARTANCLTYIFFIYK